jgi:kinesin family member 7
LDAANLKVAEMESKQKDLIAKYQHTSAHVISEKRINELELALAKAKQQHDHLQRKIKEESEKRIRNDKDSATEQQKLKDLELKNEQQQKLLKKKTEDLLAAQRRLRSAGGNGSTTNLHQTEENAINKHWIEQEMEKIVKEKRQIEQFKEELKTREDLMKKKELLSKEKSALQLKKQQQQQPISRRESLGTEAILPRVDIKELEDTKTNYVKQKKQLGERISSGIGSNAADERRLIEIDEAIEALEIAIEYENESINDQQMKLKDSIFLNKNIESSSNEVIILGLKTKTKKFF